MVDLVQQQRSALAQAYLNQAMSVKPYAPSLGSALAQGITTAVALRRYRAQLDKNDKDAEEGAALGQQAFEALTPQTETTSSYDASRDTGYGPNATGDMGGTGVLAPGMQVTQKQGQPNIDRALALALQGAQKGDTTSGFLAEALLKQRLAATQPVDNVVVGQGGQLRNPVTGALIAENPAEPKVTDAEKQKELLDFYKGLSPEDQKVYDRLHPGGITINTGNAIPDTAQTDILQGLNSAELLDTLEKNLDVTGRFQGPISKVEEFFGTNPKAVEFEAARNNFKLQAQAMIKGIPSNFDAQTAIATFPSIYAPQSVNQQRIATWRKINQQLISGRIAFYKSTKSPIPPEIIKAAKVAGIDVDNVSPTKEGEDPFGKAQETVNEFRAKTLVDIQKRIDEATTSDQVDALMQELQGVR